MARRVKKFEYELQESENGPLFVYRRLGRLTFHFIQTVADFVSNQSHQLPSMRVFRLFLVLSNSSGASLSRITPILRCPASIFRIVESTDFSTLYGVSNPNPFNSILGNCSASMAPLTKACVS